MSLTPEQAIEANSKARVNLMRIARALNATMNSEGKFVLSVRGEEYWLDGSFIVRVRHGSVMQGGTIMETTCYQSMVHTPVEEKIAGAMLYLKNCPGYFDALRNNPGHWYGFDTKNPIPPPVPCIFDPAAIRIRIIDPTTGE